MRAESCTILVLATPLANMVQLLDWVVRGDFAGESKRILQRTIFYLKELERTKNTYNNFHRLINKIFSGMCTTFS